MFSFGKSSSDSNPQAPEEEIEFQDEAKTDDDGGEGEGGDDERLRHPSGRMDHFKALLREEQQRQTVKRGFVPLTEDDDVPSAYEPQLDTVAEEGADDSPVKSKVTFEEAAALLTPEEQAIQELARRHQTMRAKVPAGTVRPEDNLVQVKLKNLSYLVPIQIDAPTKRTVVNQSLCYFAFEFFERLSSLCCGTGQSKKNATPLTPADLFSPFTKKAVLSDINLVFEPGQTYLIMGPPGCGKTSLLQAISGRLEHVEFISPRSGKAHHSKRKPHMEGSIEYNGLKSKGDREKHQAPLILPNIVSFVGQLDIHAPYLTVKETFDFARESRMGKMESIKVKEGKELPPLDESEMKESSSKSGLKSVTVVDTGISTENLTIAGLGLAHVADTFVGNNEVRGVSGGQRRRVTLGEMMQGQTPVACADEISTGLDAAVTYDICKSIVDFAKAHDTTRIVSLLQPGPETFALFDRVVILSGGQVAYAGPVAESIEYFENLGYVLPMRMDVADFLQSVTTPDGALMFSPPDGVDDDDEKQPENDNAETGDENGEAPKEGAKGSTESEGEKRVHKKHLTPDQFAEAFKQSDHYQRILDRLEESPDPVDWTTTEPPEKMRRHYQNSYFRSLQLNFKRHLTLWKRDWGYIIGKAGENVGMAVATGGILFGRAKLPSDYETESQEDLDTDFQEIQTAVYAAYFMTCLHILLGTSTSASDALDQRPIHYKHGDANFYQTGAYVAGLVASTLPQRTIEIVSFGIPLYWMVGLDQTAESFFIYLGILLLYTFALKMAYSIIAQLFPNKANVLSFGTFLVLLMTLFGGFIVYPDALPSWLMWAYYINPMAWTFQAFLITEFTSGKYDITRYTGETINYGDAFLDTRGFETSRDWIGYAAIFLVGVLIFSSIILTIVLQKVRIKPKVNTITKRIEEEIENAAEEEAEKDDFNFPFIPVDLTFEDLVYEVKASTGDEVLRLLNKVTGGFYAGRMCALMGSSGAGKTTLMDVIALRKTSGEIGGDISMNGFPQERTSFLRSSGYVEQFDVQQAELTVYETVLFSARLRLDPNNEMANTDEGKIKFTEYVLEMMELTDIEKLPVGNYEEGGLTFEQRKRLAIAVELAASPSVIFLDEPTSGLDSRGAIIIMRAMKKIANTGRTVCATIHQPSSAVFEMFDDLLLLKKGGEVVFHGELGEQSVHLIDYFEGKGAKKIQYGENPAAWMLRVYTGEDAEEVDWKAEFEESPHYTTIKEKIAAVKESQDDSKKIVYEETFATSFWSRTHKMNIRVHKIMARSPSYNLARLMIGMIYAFIIGLPFLYSNDNNRARTYTQNDVDGIISSLFLALIIMGVVSISMTVPVMKAIRDVFYKHRASGMLEHKSVLIAVTLGELPYIALTTALFCAVYYATTDLFKTADRWFYLFLFFFLNMAVYVYFGQSFICMVKDIPTAGALVGALIGFNVFFSGLVVQPQYFENVMQVGYWTAPGRYAFEGTVVSQFVGIGYDVIAEPRGAWWWSLGCGDTVNGTVVVVKDPCIGSMDAYVDFFFDGNFKQDHRGLDIGVLVFCLIVARIFLYLALKYLNYVNT